MTPRDPFVVLDDAVKECGSVAEFSRRAGFSASYVHDVIYRRRQPSENLLKALGLTRVVVKAA